MKNKIILFGFGVSLLFILGFSFIVPGSNFGRIILGEDNFGEDPNTTADITFQNDEYISNAVDGTLNFGAANLSTTGTFGAGAATVTSISATSIGATTITGSLTATDSTTSIILVASDSTFWRLRVYTNGTLIADSTGLN